MKSWIQKQTYPLLRKDNEGFLFILSIDVTNYEVAWLLIYPASYSYLNRDVTDLPLTRRERDVTAPFYVTVIMNSTVTMTVMIMVS